MTPRREDFASYEEWAEALLEQSLLELSMTKEEWEDYFNTYYPTEGYFNVLRSQADRLRRELDRLQG